MGKTATYEKLRELISENPLAVWRKRAGVTQNEIAAGVNASVSSVNRWESGAMAISDDFLFRICDFFGDESFVDDWIEWRAKLDTFRGN